MDLDLIRKIEDEVIKMGEDWATEIIRLPEVIIYLNATAPEEHFLNYTFGITDPQNIPEFVSKVEGIFEERKAKPNFSIAPYTSAGLKDYLLNNGYEQESNNAWMFFDRKKEVPEFGSLEFEIKKVKNEEEFKEFARVMVEVFSKGEEDDPYQGFSTKWGEVLLDQYRDKGKDYLLETFLVYMDNQVVGGAQLLYKGEIGYLDWLSVLPKFRKLGIGKALQGTRVKRAKELGAKYICLITEVGSRNERIFTKFGFRTEFNSLDLIKK